MNDLFGTLFSCGHLVFLLGVIQFVLIIKMILKQRKIQKKMQKYCLGKQLKEKTGGKQEALNG